MIGVFVEMQFGSSCEVTFVAAAATKCPICLFCSPVCSARPQ